MKPHIISLASLMLSVLPAMGNPHGKYYSVNGGHDSSLTILFVVVLVGFFIYAWICSMFNNKNKK